MVNVKKIMVGCDFSDFSENTVKYAATLAEKSDGQPCIAYVVPRPSS